MERDGLDTVSCVAGDLRVRVNEDFLIFEKIFKSFGPPQHIVFH